MININSILDEINSVSLDSSMCVCESMVDIIDKYENVSECDNEGITSDVIMESMTVFMEYVSKDKDAITKWMAANKYYYEGNNPNKKKKCLRMYNFLKQHKFDPATSTYESSIEGSNGQKKRIKLNIDRVEGIVMTDEDRENINYLLKYYGTTSKNGKQCIDLNELSGSTFGIKPECFDTLNKLMLISEVQSGSNSFYNTENNSITIGSGLLKSKQAIPQFILKHEEGHASDPAFGDKVSSQKESHIEKIKKSSDKYRNSMTNKGLQSNSHDDDSTENYADVYAAQNAKKRVAKGKTKNLAKNDLKRVFRYIDDMTAKVDGAIISAKNCSDSIDKEIDKWKDVLNKGKTNRNVIATVLHFDSMHAVDRVMKDDNEYHTFLKALDKLKEQLNGDFSSETLDNKSRELIKQISDYREASTKLRREIKKLDEAEAPEDQYAPLEKEYYELMHMMEECKNIESAIRRMEWDSDWEKSNDDSFKINTIRVGDKASKFSLSDRTELKVTKDLLNKIHKEAKGDPKAANGMIYDFYAPKIKKWVALLEKKKSNLDARVKALGDFKDISTAVRYGFAKKYVKEYFDDLFDDSDIYSE